MSLRISVIEHILVANHVCCREDLLVRDPASPKFLPNVFAQRWRLSGNAPGLEHHARYITLLSMVPAV